VANDDVGNRKSNANRAATQRANIITVLRWNT